MAELLLGVNIDHIATVRNAREHSILILYKPHLLQNKQELMVLLCICEKIAAILLIGILSC